MFQGTNNEQSTKKKERKKDKNISENKENKIVTKR